MVYKNNYFVDFMPCPNSHVSHLDVFAAQDYSKSYHQARQRQATQNTDLIAAFTMDLLSG